MKCSKEVVAQLCAEDLSTETVKNFRENLRGLAREIFFEVIAEEVSELCGPRHYPVNGARYRRAGSASGRIYWDGQWEKVSRPRVRRSGGGGGGEVNLRSYQAAKDLEKFLKTRSKGAYESLRKGWDELTAFQRLEVPSTLNTSFLSTNFIENGFNNVRREIGRVKRWRVETGQPEKWLAFALREAEKGFKRIRNAGGMKTLIAALKRPTGD